MAIVTPRRHEIPYLDDAFYVQQALMPPAAGGGSSAGGGAIRGTVLEAKDLAGATLQDYAVVYCVNLPALDDEAAGKLRQYVEGGGHVFWFCGENVQPAAYNAMNQKAQSRLLPCPLLEVRTAQSAAGRDSWRIGFIDEKDRALAPLVRPEPLYQSVLIYKYVAMSPLASRQCRTPQQARCLSHSARLSHLARPRHPASRSLPGSTRRGEPLLVQRKEGRGSVTMLGTARRSDGRICRCARCFCRCWSA